MRPEASNPDPMGMPSPSRRPSTPTVNFNGMIAPLIPYAIRGVIWYQGENNAGRGLEYRELFPRLIEDWRNVWQKAGYEAGKDFPFLFVQLPSNGQDASPIAAQGWPWLREAQLLTLKVPRTGMAITLDVGDPNNVHPGDKIDVGQRLALLARKTVYGEEIVASGPLYQDFKVEADGSVRVRFTETGSGLTIGQAPWYAAGVAPFPKDKLIGFFIAGEDKKWVEAHARVDGNSVVVSSAQVPKPAAVRYGWANSPRCNLYNKEGLPASPFRTDTW
jgi:sialate O-acetylesterase